MIYSKTKEEHLKHLQLVFQLLRDSRFYLKLSKCSFMETWTLFLGYYVGPEGIKPDPAKISTVKDWLVPSNVTEVRAFLGLCNFFRRFRGKSEAYPNRTPEIWHAGTRNLGARGKKVSYWKNTRGGGGRGGEGEKGRGNDLKG
jgi:hypothetical protein